MCGVESGKPVSKSVLKAAEEAMTRLVEVLLEVWNSLRKGGLWGLLLLSHSLPASWLNAPECRHNSLVESG